MIKHYNYCNLIVHHYYSRSPERVGKRKDPFDEVDEGNRIADPWLAFHCFRDCWPFSPYPSGHPIYFDWTRHPVSSK